MPYYSIVLFIHVIPIPYRKVNKLKQTVLAAITVGSYPLFPIDPRYSSKTANTVFFSKEKNVVLMHYCT